MEKWTRKAVIETVAFPLSEEWRELARLELADIKESASSGKATLSCRINAIYAGTTKNLHTYPVEELEATVGKWTKPYPKPILVNHYIDSEPLGRVSEEVFLKEGETRGVLQLKARLSDPDAIEKVLDGRYLTVSIGCKPAVVECSICGANWFEEECDHLMGETYVVDQVGTQALCTAIMRNIAPVECSFVNLPADSDEDHFAGIVTIGESDGFEFYSEAEGVGQKSWKRKAMSSEDALAFKESFEEFLSLLKPTEAKAESMDVTDETKPVLEEEEPVDEAVTGDTGTPEATETETPEANEQQSDEAMDEDTENSVEESDAEALLSILAEETEEEAEETETPTDESEPTELEALQARVQQLEAEVQERNDALAKQEAAAQEWFKAVRVLLGGHLADLKVALGKATSETLEDLQAEEAEKTIKAQISELRELREEFKLADFSIAPHFTQSPSIQKESLVPEETKGGATITQSEKPKPFIPLTETVIGAFSNVWSNRPHKQG